MMEKRGFEIIERRDDDDGVVLVVAVGKDAETLRFGWVALEENRCRKRSEARPSRDSRVTTEPWANLAQTRRYYWSH